MAVGSSGGHIYPAVAVAEELEGILSESSDRLDIHFVHSGYPLGKKILSSLKYPVHEIFIGGLAKGQSFSQKIKTMFQLPIAFIQSLRLVKKLKAQVILGTGGSVTGPVLISGFLMSCRIAIWEGNAVMGLANRWLAPFVSCVFTVFSKVKGVSQKKQIFCAYPLRKKVCGFSESVFKEDHLKPKGGQAIFKVLILGGSQGSFMINQVVSQALEEESWRKGIFIYHQTGEKSFALMKKRYHSLSGVEAFAFSLNIENYYKQCHLVFSRAGSGAIWEAASYGKAIVLIPLDHSAGGHQLKNALELSSKNCVEMIREQDFNVTVFKDQLIRLKGNEKKRKQLAQSLKKAYQGNGARRIADWILSQK